MEKNLKQLTEELNFECLTGNSLLERAVQSAYVSDLLSDVMGKAQPKMLWVTSQVHKNIVAVASLKELSAVIVVNERIVAQEVLDHAEAEEVVILTSGMPAFETAGILYEWLKEVD
ncbi:MULTISPECIES: serine kinase [Proteiniphilum]|jgi:serine kinase of HPr protein (carbohydrate metabolism regulator)|uniref:serine kinase n=1 Tax=Proteiniphilum TaxID=294702 RepID=UPI001EEC726B|nr:MULTISPECIES: serine kinase [Proteiniphilum]ULB34865.1 serine kinase [Proteiniphilum propionicum]